MSLLSEHKLSHNREKLNAIDQLRELFQGQEKEFVIPLPSIVVVGDQSVGKSSVLEALSNIALPRAEQICTRCPLELRLVNISSTQTEYAEIYDSKNQDPIKIELHDIQEHVLKRTNALAGNNNGISESTIYLKVYKVGIPNLTLVDLPGITRIPVGEQPKDIYEQTIKLIKKHIQHKEAIILNIIPATLDFTTSQSMKLSGEVDLKGERTFIVASKIDQISTDKLTNIREKLEGTGGDIKCKLGCIAVRTRNNEEIYQNITHQQMLQIEEDFFMNHPVLVNVARIHKGIPELASKLTKLQHERIRSTLPKIQENIESSIVAKQKQLNRLSTALTTTSECRNECLKQVSRLADILDKLILGEIDDELMNVPELPKVESENYDTKIESDMDMNISKCIYQLQRICGERIMNCFSNFLSRDYAKKIDKELTSTRGKTLPNFTDFSVLRRLFQPEVENVSKPCIQLLCDCHEYIEKVVMHLVNYIFQPHVRLITIIHTYIKSVLKTAVSTCESRILELICIERRVYTINHYYMDTISKIKEKIQEQREKLALADFTTKPRYYGTSSNNNTVMGSNVFDVKVNDISLSVAIDVSNEAQAVLDMQISMVAYSKVVSKRVSDTVTQYVYYHLITNCVNQLKLNLMQYLTNENEIDLLRVIGESEDQKEARLNVQQAINKLQDGLKVIYKLARTI